MQMKKVSAMKLKKIILLILFSFCIFSAYAQAEIEYNEKGISLISAGDYTSAIYYLNKSISSNPNYADAYSNRGLAYKNIGEYDKAMDDLNKAIQLNPDLYAAYNNRALVKIILKQYKSAILDCDKAIKINNRSYYPFQNRAVANSYLGNYLDAINDYKSALEIDSTNANSNLSIANVYIILEDLDNACEFLHKAYLYGSSEAQDLIYQYCDDNKFYNLGLQSFNNDDYNLTIKYLSQYLEINPYSVETYLVRLLSYFKTYDLANAKSDAKKVIEMQPNSPDGYFMLGSIEMYQEENESALLNYNYGLSLDPENVIGYWGRGVVKFNLGNFDEAILDFDMAIFLDSLNADAYYYRGLAKYYLADEYGGCIDLKKANELGYAYQESFNELGCQAIIKNEKTNMENEETQENSNNSIKNSHFSLCKDIELQTRINSQQNFNIPQNERQIQQNNKSILEEAFGNREEFISKCVKGINPDILVSKKDILIGENYCACVYDNVLSMLSLNEIEEFEKNNDIESLFRSPEKLSLISDCIQESGLNTITQQNSSKESHDFQISQDMAFSICINDILSNNESDIIWTQQLAEKYCNCYVGKIYSSNFSYSQLLNADDDDSEIHNEIVIPCLNEILSVNENIDPRTDVIGDKMYSNIDLIDYLGVGYKIKLSISGVIKYFILDTGQLTLQLVKKLHPNY